jgi:uncharacterized protein (DUF58 family)
MRSYAFRLAGLPERFALWLGRNSLHTLPQTLDRRRIYVLPTGAGMGFAAALLVMLVGAINYGLSLGYALVFLLFGIGMSATVHAFRNLLGVTITRMHVEPAFAGQSATLQTLIENRATCRRAGLSLRCGEAESRIDLEAGTSTDIALEVPTERRGWMPIGSLRVGTTWPLGLVRAWSVLRPGLSCLVYPAPEPQPPHLPEAGTETPQGALSRHNGDDDFAGLRPHRLTDSPRHVAWKAAASGGPLLTKGFAAQQGASVLLDWMTLYGLDDDARAARLAAWVMMAERRGLRYALRTPEGLLDADTGQQHLRNCLARLALARSNHEHG